MKTSQLLTLQDQPDFSTSPSLAHIPSSTRIQTEMPHLSPHELKSSLADSLSILASSQTMLPPESVARRSIIKKGANINRVLQKEMGKHKLSTLGREKKFEKKFKAFEQLNTFIDIKDYLKQMNTVNTAHNTISRPLESLQSLPSIMKSKTQSMAVSPKANEGSSASKTWKPNFSGAVAQRAAKRTSSCGGDVGLMLQDAKGYITKYLEDQETKIDVNEQPVRNHRRTSTMAVNSLVNNEENNNEYFYAAIDELIAKENLDDLRQFRTYQDVVDFHKSRFRFHPAETKIDERYYQNYKLRADKVIHLLGVASKKIYNKSLSHKPLRSSSNKTLTEVKTPQAKKSSTPRFETFMSSGKFMDTMEAMETSPSQSLAMKFRRTQHKANTIIKQQSKEAIGSSCGSILSVADKVRQDKKMNQQLNKVYNHFMSDIVNQAEVEEAHYKNMKYQFQNDISTLEQAYNAQVEQILPKPLESIRKIDPYHTKIYKRSLKTKISGKMITTAYE